MNKKNEKNEKNEKTKTSYIPYSIPVWKIEKLVKAGEDFKIPFNLPPFDGDCTEAYYNIDKMRKTKDFKNFLSIIDSLNVHYEYAFCGKDKKTIYMAVKVSNKEKKI